MKILENPFPAADPGALMQLGTARTHALLDVHGSFQLSKHINQSAFVDNNGVNPSLHIGRRLRINFAKECVRRRETVRNRGRNGGSSVVILFVSNVKNRSFTAPDK